MKQSSSSSLESTSSLVSFLTAFLFRATVVVFALVRVTGRRFIVEMVVVAFVIVVRVPFVWMGRLFGDGHVYFVCMNFLCLPCVFTYRSYANTPRATSSYGTSSVDDRSRTVHCTCNCRS